MIDDGQPVNRGSDLRPSFNWTQLTRIVMLLLRILLIMAEVSPLPVPVPTQRFFNDLAGSLYLLPADTIEGRRCAAMSAATLAPSHAAHAITLADRDHVLDSGSQECGLWTSHRKCPQACR